MSVSHPSTFNIFNKKQLFLQIGQQTGGRIQVGTAGTPMTLYPPCQNIEMVSEDEEIDTKS